MIKCSTGKKVFVSRDDAVQALLSARVKYDYNKRSGPIAVYRCEDCGYFHLTSKGVMDETLSKEIKTGKIDLEKEAAKWKDKFDKR